MKTYILFIVALLNIFRVSAQRIITLEECINEARHNNITALNAENELKMAEEQRKWIRTKNYPTVSVNAYAFRANDYLIKKDLFDGELQDFINTVSTELGLGYDLSTIKALKSGASASLSVIQPVYTGGRLNSINKLADLQVDARQKLLDVSDDGVVQKIQILYYSILKLHGKIKTLDASDREIASILKDVRNLVDEGIVNSNDALSVELVQDQLSALRVRTDNACKLLRRALAKALGNPDEDIDVDTTLNTNIVHPRELWIDPTTAVSSRNESQLLDMNVRRMQLETKIAKANLRPILAVGGNLSVSRFIATRSNGIIYGLFTMPISAFWSENHEVKRKKIAEQMALDMRKDKRELMNLQVRDAYDNLNSAYEQIQISKKSIVRATENLRVKREQYINGVTNMSVLLDAQRQLQQAQDQYSDAICDYQQSRSTYLIETGRKEQSFNK